MALTSYPVSPMYWTSAKKKGWDDPTAKLGIYLLTCEHRNLEGLYRIPKMYMTSDHGWTETELEKRFSTLLQAGFVKYNEFAEVILLPKALDYYTPKSDRQIQGAIRALHNVPDTTLWPDFLIAPRKYAPKFFQALGGEHELAKFDRPESNPHTHTDTPSDGYAEAA